MANNLHNRRHINEQRKQDKFKLINSTSNNNNLCTNSKANQKIDYVISGPGMVADREESAKKKPNIKIHQECDNVFTGINWMLQRKFLLMG